MHKIYNSIGLAYRSRNLEIGTDLILAKVKRNQIKLVIITADCSLNTMKLIQNKCEFYKVKVLVLNDYEQNLSKIFNRKKIKVIGISNSDFFKLIIQNLEE